MVKTRKRSRVDRAGREIRERRGQEMRVKKEGGWLAKREGENGEGLVLGGNPNLLSGGIGEGKMEN